MKSTNDIRVCIVGSTGFAGAELCRIILGHPIFKLTKATDRKAVGVPLSKVYPSLLGICDITLSTPDVDAIAASADVVFLAVPHTASLLLTPSLIKQGLTVIDLSADYRIEDPEIYESWYGVKHTSSELLNQAVYGLPELNREELLALSQKYKKGEPVLVAAPGCYPTATALAALPALEAGVVEGDLVISDAISGVSGAGRTPSERTHYCHANESVEAYSVAGHRHTPEMEQTLSHAAGRTISVIFTPHLAPLTRGLLATVYLPIRKGITKEELQLLYERRYAREPMVTVLAGGVMPQTSSVAGSARAQIGLALDVRLHHMAIVSCAIDNLGKGAAGQAVQAANIVCGLSETMGIAAPAPII
jgi:N-acetyl-gamma-glutamyl-phosphate reductase